MIPARTSAPAVRREGGLSANSLPAERRQAGDCGAEAFTRDEMGLAGRARSCFAASTTRIRSCRSCSTSGCGSCSPSTAACSGSWRPWINPSEKHRGARRRGAASTRNASCSRALRCHAGAPRAASPRRYRPRYAAAQCPYDGERRLMGWGAGADLSRHDLRGPRRGEPAARRRASPSSSPTSLADYEALAGAAGGRPCAAAGLRERLRQSAAFPLFDTSRYRRQIEAAYSTMWEIWQRTRRAPAQLQH